MPRRSIARLDVPDSTATTTDKDNLQYRYDIDGLRAIAVLAVVIYHLTPGVVPNGYLGVDLFFVISGYLITGIIWREMRNGHFSIVKFYERRIRRILPALLFLLIVVAAVSSLILLPTDLIGLAKSILATLAFSANIYFWQDTNYFAQSADTKPLLNLWSLGVEEQFYIVFPLILVLLTRLANNRAIAIVSFLVVISFAGDIFMRSIGAASPAFYLLPTRAWEMGVGSVIAMLHVGKKRSQSAVLGVLGMILIVVSLYLNNDFVPSIPPGTLTVFGAALVCYYGIHPGSAAGAVICSGPARFMGLISYSLYLWHWPIIVLLQYWLIRSLNVVEVFGAAALSLGLAYFSWKFIEQPFRRKDVNFSRVGKISLAGYASSTVLAIALILSGGLPARLPQESAQINAAIGTHYRCDLRSMMPFGASRACGLFLPNNDPQYARVVLLGNSHAQMYAPLVAQITEELKVPSLLVPINGCLPNHTLNISESCASSAKKNFDAVRDLDEVQVVVLAQSWPLDRLPKSAGISEEERALSLAMATVSLSEELEENGILPIIVAPLATPGVDYASILSRQIAYGRLPRLEDGLAVRQFQNVYGSALEYIEQSPYHIIRADQVQCKSGECKWVVDGQAVFSDGNHVSENALHIFEQEFERVLTKALQHQPQS